MSLPPKRPKFSDEITSSNQISLSQTSNGSCSSQPDDSNKRKFNFWLQRKSEPKHETMDPTKDETGGQCIASLTAGRKANAIHFRVAHISIAETKYGKRLSLLGYDATGQAELFAFREVAEDVYKSLHVGYAYKVQNYFVKEVGNLKDSTNALIELLKSSDLQHVDDSGIPGLEFNFLNILEIRQLLEESSTNAKADFAGVLVRTGELRFTSSGKPMRVLDLTDETKENIQVKLWGKEAEMENLDEYCVVLIRQAGVKSYMGDVYLNFEFGTAILVNPDHPKAKTLQEWFKAAVDEKMDVE